LKAAGNETSAEEKTRQAMTIMTRIGEDPNCRPMLGLEDGRPIAGWFKDGYQALLDARSTVDIEACQTFFRYFTFNYW
jgi:hypothetical protein